uniref:Uncharacterized protein n=1 Tax=Glossina palpalis gambiensis TaxID=67801 RepID=A0A1B0BKU0_9MUSC
MANHLVGDQSSIPDPLTPDRLHFTAVDLTDLFDNTSVPAVVKKL